MRQKPRSGGRSCLEIGLYIGRGHFGTGPSRSFLEDGLSVFRVYVTGWGAARPVHVLPEEAAGAGGERGAGGHAEAHAAVNDVGALTVRHDAVAERAALRAAGAATGERHGVRAVKRLGARRAACRGFRWRKVWWKWKRAIWWCVS